MLAFSIEQLNESKQGLNKVYSQNLPPTTLLNNSQIHL
jgi:hypothetical protein